MILRLGSSNSNVKELQTILKELGFYTYPSVTGYFGAVTQSSVISFQRAYGLKDDGIVGNQTWSKLNEINKPKLDIKPIVEPAIITEDKGEDINLYNIPKTDGKYPTSSKAMELVGFISMYIFTRNVDRIVWHCTASRQNASTKDIIDYHTKTLGWSRAGYHIIIDMNGHWTYAVDFNTYSNGVKGMNNSIINICYIGGIDRVGKALDNRTKEQLETQELLYWIFKQVLPKATHHGHNEFDNKDCPSYKVADWIKVLESKRALI